jgi:hypothetical protein
MRQARWVISFLVLILAPAFFVGLARSHAAAEPEARPDEGAGLSRPGPELTSLRPVAYVTGLDSAIDVTASRPPAAAPSQWSIAGSVAATPAPAVRAAPAPMAPRGASPPALAPDDDEAEAESPDEEAPALPLIYQSMGWAGPEFHPLEPPPSYDDPIGEGAGIGTVPEGLGVDPLPGERDALGAGQSHLGVEPTR